jgi:23S rRNA pseudouridine1911/1915/1917 synthase
VAAPSADKHRFVVPPEGDGERLDRLLAAHVPGLSRTRARVLLDIGGVFVDGARVKMAGRALRAGQVVEAFVGGALERATKATGRAARARDEEDLAPPVVLYEDADVVAVDKHPTQLSAPTPESDRGNLVSLLEAELGGRIWVVHRLDLGTSGVLLYARTAHANRVLAETFRAHDVEREYLAVLEGTPELPRRVETPIDGRRAVTDFELVERLGEIATLVRCRLGTGRTHQIRLHAKTLGSFVLGDKKHGSRTRHDPPRLALHAARLALAHPSTGERLELSSELPDDLASWISTLRESQ